LHVGGADEVRGVSELLRELVGDPFFGCGRQPVPIECRDVVVGDPDAQELVLLVAESVEAVVRP
jgi:hypothetical protein